MEYIEHKNIRFMDKLKRYEPILQDHTAMNVLKTCDRKYFYRIVLGYATRSNNNQVVLDFGSAGHKFMEVLELTFQKTGSADTAFGEALKAALSMPLSVPPAGNKFAYLDRVRLMQTLKECYAYWLKEKSNKVVEVLGVEQPLNTMLPDGSYTSGRMDQLIKWSGLLWDRDFKFTSKDQQMFQKQTDPNDQATRYIYMGTKLHGSNFQGVIFQCIVNTKTTGPKIVQVPTQRTSRQLQVWEDEQVHINRQLALNREHDTWPMREHNCAWCEYANVCRRPNEQSQVAALQSDFVLKPWDHTNVEQKEVSDG